MADVEAEIRRIFANRKDYYAVLGVGRNATVDEIRRAYRRQALKLHPDKNENSPRANEAFKIISTANTILTDSEKKRVYDARGEEGVKQHESGARPTYRRYPHAMDPQDVFETFFGGRRPGVNVEEINFNAALLLPLFMFLILALLLSSNLFDIDPDRSPRRGRGYSSIPSFSLHRNYREGHHYRRITNLPDFPELRVEYYVSPNLPHMYPADARLLDLKVLRAYKEQLERRCQAEMIKKRSGRASASDDPCRKYEKMKHFRFM